MDHVQPCYPILTLALLVLHGQRHNSEVYSSLTSATNGRLLSTNAYTKQGTTYRVAQ